MPAHNKRSFRLNRKVRKVHKSKSKKSPLRKIIIVLVTIALIGLVAKLMFRIKYWNPEGKLPVAVQEDNGDVSIFILDAKEGEITKLKIPGDTEVEVADNLGVWRLKSVWDLGVNENKEGKLLSNTLTRHFYFPTYIWSDSGFLQFTDGNPVKSLLAVFSQTKTNLSYGDKIGIALFSIKTNNINRDEIDISKTNLLRKTVLKDGEEGYILSGYDSPGVYSKFSENRFLGKTVRVMIRDASGTYGAASKVGRILEVMGTKVSSINKEDNKDIICEVSGKKELEEALKTTALVLGCEVGVELLQNNFDLVVTLGTKY